MRILDTLALILVIIGAVNWGLIGILDYNLVSSIFGVGTFSNIIYSIVGISGLYCLSLFTKLNYEK